MHVQTGNCPHCGAPIYAQSPWMSILPPPPVYTCSCVRQQTYVVTLSAADFIKAAQEGIDAALAKLGKDDLP